MRNETPMVFSREFQVKGIPVDGPHRFALSLIDRGREAHTELSEVSFDPKDSDKFGIPVVRGLQYRLIIVSFTSFAVTQGDGNLYDEVNEAGEPDVVKILFIREQKTKGFFYPGKHGPPLHEWPGSFSILKKYEARMESFGATLRFGARPIPMPRFRFVIGLTLEEYRAFDKLPALTAVRVSFQLIPQTTPPPIPKEVNES